MRKKRYERKLKVAPNHTITYHRRKQPPDSRRKGRSFRSGQYPTVSLHILYVDCCGMVSYRGGYYPISTNVAQKLAVYRDRYTRLRHDDKQIKNLRTLYRMIMLT